MYLFSKKEIECFKKQYQENIEIMDDHYQNIMNRDREWLRQLLTEKSELESKVKLLQNSKTKLEEKVKILQEDYDVSWVDTQKSEQEKIELKEKLRGVSATLGGTTKQNHKLLKRIGELELYCGVLEEKLKKSGIRKPTMQDFQEYEMTHKSPFKKKSDVQQ